MNFPENLKYSKDHEWVRVEGEFAYVGITDFAQSELGDIVFVDINTVGQTFKAGEVFGTVEAVKTVSDLFMPIDGEIVEKNEDLNNEPDQVNADPYEKGWMIKVKVSQDSNTNGLMDAEAYKAFVGA